MKEFNTENLSDMLWQFIESAYPAYENNSIMLGAELDNSNFDSWVSGMMAGISFNDDSIDWEELVEKLDSKINKSDFAKERGITGSVYTANITEVKNKK